VTAATIEDIRAAIPDPLPTGRRLIIAIAGPPAAGKSTLAQELCDALATGAAVLGMDAFHYDNAVLAERGHLDRKGAPHTFDVDGYRRTLERLCTNADSEIAIPVFDRSLELTRASAAIVTPAHRIVITEGNYLLFEDAPWPTLRSLFDLTVWLAPTIAEIESRILRRWTELGHTTAQAAAKAELNDLPNARAVLDNSAAAQIASTAQP